MLNGYGATILDGAWLTVQLALLSMLLAVVLGLFGAALRLSPMKWLALLGETYAARCGMTLLDDPTVVDLYGTPTLLLHGDLLCTDDTAYQQFRAQTRDPRWQAQFLAQPLAARLAFAAQARAASQARYGELVAKGMAETIGDVAPATVQDWFTRFGVQRMIHGHTHRPAIHDEGDGRTRIVLGDWYEQGSALRIGAGVTDLASLTQA